MRRGAGLPAPWAAALGAPGPASLAEVLRVL